MTAANGLPPNGTAHSPLQRCWANVVVAFALLGRPAKHHAPRLWPAQSRPLAIAAAVMLAVFLICIIFIDGPVAQAVMRAPRWLIWPFDQITDFGKSGWVLWPLGLLFLALGALPPLTRFSQAVVAAVMVRVGFLFLAIGVPGLFVSIVKRMIGRARPLATGHIDPFAFAPFIWRADYASLPSGHATTAFAILVAFGTLWPRARTALLLYALAISLSRVMVMAHYPSDVLAGAVVGSAGAIMVRSYFASRRLAFGETIQGAPIAFSGPSWRRIKAVGRALLAD
jgi:membrane-associated phospholipid phosphatase